MKKVVISIKSGKVTADFSGFVGKSCETLESKIRPAGLDIEHKELKPEYHYSAEQEQTNSFDSQWS